MVALGLLAQPRHGAALRGRGERDPLPAGPDQEIEMLGRRRAGAVAAAAALRLAGSTFDALRAAWRSEASSGTRACAPGCAVICADGARRNPSWRSRRVLGERLNRVVGWLLRRPAALIRIASEW